MVLIFTFDLILGLGVFLKERLRRLFEVSVGVSGKYVLFGVGRGRKGFELEASLFE